MAAQRSLKRSVFVAILALSCAVAIITVAIVGIVYQKSQIDDAYKTLAGEIDALDELQGGNLTQDLLHSIELSDTRVTLIAQDGSVIFDSTTDADSLPNHKDRPEVVEALQKGVGKSERASTTVGYVSIYYAKLLSSGEVLRLSTDRSAITNIFMKNAAAALVFLAALILISYIASTMLSKRLVAPILALDLDAEETPLKSPYIELNPLVDRLVEQKDQLVGQVRDLKELNQMRRHFSANITHELKTPIASIMGASELIKTGICQPDDIVDFAGRIYKEASRLSSLVTDILTLSKLDESERADDRILFGSPEPIDVYKAAKDVVERLRHRAEKRSIKLHLRGSHEFILGYPKLIDELIGNLVDNAIRYNKDAGEVFVLVLPLKDRVEISVADTGIGIDPEVHDKVFERFWRADTSRSRQLGGTGLGLAIVKHAANFHNAQITLESELGEGTTIRVCFDRLDYEALKN